jgi:LuxR family maltose regulon positive regulatory protein
MVSLTAATILDMRGEVAAAAEAVDSAVASARQGGAVPEIVKALLVKAEIVGRLGDRQSAEASRNEAAALLRRCAGSGMDPTLVAAAEQNAHVAIGARNVGGATDDELTPKELEILRLLATRLSRREIGQRLYVSLNTVKTHQRALYRKLGVDDRISAVTRARDLGLL